MERLASLGGRGGAQPVPYYLVSLLPLGGGCVGPNSANFCRFGSAHPEILKWQALQSKLTALPQLLRPIIPRTIFYIEAGYRQPIFLGAALPPPSLRPNPLRDGNGGLFEGLRVGCDNPTPQPHPGWGGESYSLPTPPLSFLFSNSDHNSTLAPPLFCCLSLPPHPTRGRLFEGVCVNFSSDVLLCG